MSDDYARYFPDPSERSQFDDLAGRIMFADGYIDQPPESWAWDHPLLQRLRPEDFLALFKGVGLIRARRWVESVGVAPGRRLSGLSDRQRKELHGLLAEQLGR